MSNLCSVFSEIAKNNLRKSKGATKKIRGNRILFEGAIRKIEGIYFLPPDPNSLMLCEKVLRKITNLMFDALKNSDALKIVSTAPLIFFTGPFRE